MKRLIALGTAAFFVLGLTAAVSAAPQAPAAPAAATDAPPPPPPPPAVNVGDQVQAWSAPNMVDGAVVTSASLAGKSYALVFVNSSCAACRGELTDLMTRTFKDNVNIFVVGMDVGADRALKVYKDMLKVPFTILHDANQEVAGKFDLFYTPASVIVDKDGKLEARFGGYAPKMKAEILKAFDKYSK